MFRIKHISKINLTYKWIIKSFYSFIFFYAERIYATLVSSRSTLAMGNDMYDKMERYLRNCTQ